MVTQEIINDFRKNTEEYLESIYNGTFIPNNKSEEISSNIIKNCLIKIDNEFYFKAIDHTVMSLLNIEDLLENFNLNKNN